MKRPKGDNYADDGDELDDEAQYTPQARSQPLSTKRPTAKPSNPVQVEAGLPKDRLKGYRKDKARTRFTGADARAALVGAYNSGKLKKRPSGFNKGERFKGHDDEALY